MFCGVCVFLIIIQDYKNKEYYLSNCTCALRCWTNLKCEQHNYRSATGVRTQAWSVTPQLSRSENNTLAANLASYQLGQRGNSSSSNYNLLSSAFFKSMHIKFTCKENIDMDVFFARWSTRCSDFLWMKSTNPPPAVSQLLRVCPRPSRRSIASRQQVTSDLRPLARITSWAWTSSRVRTPPRSRTWFSPTGGNFFPQSHKKKKAKMKKTCHPLTRFVRL